MTKAEKRNTRKGAPIDGNSDRGSKNVYAQER